MMEGDDNSFSPVERLIGSSRKDGGKRISNMRSSQQISRKISLEHPKDVDISARKLTNQYHLASTERSIALTGGLKLSKEGSVYIKLSGFTGWFAGWQKKHCVLENGQFKLYKAKRVSIYGKEAADAEIVISLVDIRWIEYTKRGATTFSFVFGSSGKQKAVQSADPYRKTRISFKLVEPSEVEDWLQHLLLELKNQALFLDQSASVLIDLKGSPEKVEAILRQSVDLWTLAVGKINAETAKAQERLKDWLERDLINNHSEEASFWAQSAEGIRKEIETRNKIVSNWENARGSVRKGLKLALHDLRNEDSTASGTPLTALAKLQEETALFGLSRSEHRIELNEVEKWKMLGGNDIDSYL